MKVPFLVEKYVKQFKAMNPKYDTVYTVSGDEPMVFENGTDVRLAFACIADTHLPNRESAEKNLENVFLDIKTSKEKFDALLMAGDIADYGFNSEYGRFFRVLDKYKNGSDIVYGVRKSRKSDNF